jgi:hypothetical protein
MKVTQEIREIVAMAVRGDSSRVRELPKDEQGRSVNWCPCGRTILFSHYFPFDKGHCPYCANNPDVAKAVLSGAIKSVTHWKEYAQIKRRFDMKKLGVRVCLACGVTLSGRSHARTCSPKCRKRLSRSPVNVEVLESEFAS